MTRVHEPLLTKWRIVPAGAARTRRSGGWQPTWTSSEWHAR